MTPMAVQLQSFASHWKSLDFSSWNEADVREEFIAPLLRVLGYAKGTTADVLREKTLRLSTPYHRVGRQRVDIDYVPTIRLKSFWIIEAKPGLPRQMQYGDLLQAHLYAVHPEINAVYIVLCNGWEVRVYDALRAQDWNDPIVVASQSDCDRTLPDIEALISARQVLGALRDRLLVTVRNTFSIDVDVAALEAFGARMQSTLIQLHPVVEKNARELELLSWKKADEETQAALKAAQFDALMVWMDMPTNPDPGVPREIVERVIAMTPEDQQKFVDRLCQTYRARPHSICRINALQVLLLLYERGVDPPPTSWSAGIPGNIEELITSNFDYWPNSELSQALCHLDNTTLRVAKKLGLRAGAPEILRRLEEMRLAMPAEAWIEQSPRTAGAVLAHVGLLAERLWRLYAGANEAQTVWEGIWTLEAVESAAEPLPVVPLPDAQRDLLFFEQYGRGFDMLCVGTHWVLQRHGPALSKLPLSQRARELASLNREQAIARIPEAKRPPVDWRPTNV